jgi:hypothetical protein
MPRKKQSWLIGDQFLVPLPDGSASRGQVVGQEPRVLNSVTCAFYSAKLSPNAKQAITSLDSLIACLFTTRDLLDNGTWRVLGHAPVTIPPHLFPFEETRHHGWVGAKVYGSQIVAEFLAAFHCLAPWDDWADPTYLDRLLITPDKKPTKLVLKRT